MPRRGTRRAPRSPLARLDRAARSPGRTDLLGQCAHELKAECLGLAEVQAGGKADPVVLDGEPVPILLQAHAHADLSAAVSRKRVLQRIRHQLVDDQPAGHRQIDPEDDLVELDTVADTASRVVGAEELRNQRPDVLREIDAREVLRAVQHLVDQRHRADPILAFSQQLADGSVGDLGRLQPEQAGGDLQVVLDAVVDLLEQELLLAQGALDDLLGALALGDVEGDTLEQEGPAGFVRDQPRLAVHPDDLAGPGEETAYRPERTSSRAAARELAIPQLAIVGVELPEPEHWIAHPFLLREPEQRLDLRADVDVAETSLERSHERDRRDLFHQRAIAGLGDRRRPRQVDRKSTRLNSSHLVISYAVFCLKKKNKK